MGVLGLMRGGKFAAVLCAGLAIAACSKTPDNLATGAASAIPGSAQDFAQNIGDRIYFESDSSDLNQRAQETVDRQVAWLQRWDRGTFTVEGHADERGTREYNFALGARRAEATKQYMIARGIPAGRIHTISFGKERPVAVCDDISCWSQNRRAVTVVGDGQS